MNRKERRYLGFKNEDHFTLHQRAIELKQAISRWANSILTGRRIEELREVEEKLKKYDN